MDRSKTVKEAIASYGATDLREPLILEQNGQPFAVLISYADYERFQGQPSSAREARRIADRFVLRDLVGCALTSGEPIFVAAPHPHWRVPYRYLGGELLAIVHVDAFNGTVDMSEEVREALLEKVEQQTIHATP
ncbi:MAG: type II toxin-antitoxin system prevent-host-death family antitoxin [Anaerolineae bacterium]|nr:type II toxin-antitoxin system prevent-host-death family antitoxin [Anaerolineae bacterium]